MKKIISLLTVVALLMSFAVVASAVGETQATAYDLADPELWSIMSSENVPFWVTYDATENAKIQMLAASPYTAKYADGTPITVAEENGWFGPEYKLEVVANANETVYIEITPAAEDYYSWNIMKQGCFEWPLEAQMGAGAVTGDSWNVAHFDYIAPADGTLTLTIDTDNSTNGWTYQMGPKGEWGIMPVDSSDAVWTFDSSTENDDFTNDWYPNGSASSRTINVTAGTAYMLIIGNFNEDNGEVVGTVNYTLAFEAGAHTDDQFGGQGGQGAAPIDPNAGMDENNPIMIDFNMNYVVVPAGATRWFLYSDFFLPMTGVQSLMLNVSSPIDYAVIAGVVTTVPDADGFVNLQMFDRTGMGNYLFAITNNSAEDADFYPYFELVPDYVITGVELQIGQNNVTLNAEQPNALYSFTNENNGGAGKYQFTVTDKNGNPITDALLGDWNSIGYPIDLTGEDKSSSIIWNTSEEAGSFLLGVAGVTEDEFVIVVERIGDYEAPSGGSTDEFEKYENTHTPNAEFEMPEGTLIALDIKNPQTIVLGTDGYYHLNTATGPIVFVDMTNAAINLVNAYGAYGANAMRGEHEGKKYDFLDAMKAYANAIDEEGYYPLTEDLAAFLQGYGVYQGWFFPGLSPVEAIQSGEANADSAWMFACSYIEGVNSLATNNENGTGTETVKPVPPTGDFGVIAAAIAMGMSAICGTAVIVKKKED